VREIFSRSALRGIGEDEEVVDRVQPPSFLGILTRGAKEMKQTNKAALILNVPCQNWTIPFLHSKCSLTLWNIRNLIPSNVLIDLELLNGTYESNVQL
jgi:hypothetical protein